MTKALEALSDAYNLSYDSAMKNTQANLDSFNTTKSEIEKLESEAQQYKETLSSLGDKYEVDLSGIESIDEMISKLRQSGKLELTDEAELAKIDSQNASLERQLDIKEKLANSQQKQAAADARDALGRGEQSVAQQVAQFVPGGKKRYQGQVNNVGVVEAVNENVLAIQEYENAIEKAEKAMKDLDPDSKAWKEQEENINSYNEAIEKLTEDLNTKETDLTTLLSAFSVNGEGFVALDGYEEEFKAVKDAIENLNNINLSPAEQKLAKIESYFDGSVLKNSIKTLLQEAYDETGNLEDALDSMGVTLDDIGIENISALEDYFKSTTSAVEEATKSVRDYATTVSEVEAAGESANQDEGWAKMSKANKTANELLKEGKTGTDDFQSYVSFLSPQLVKDYVDKGSKYTADAYQKAFEKVKKTANRWFGEDETKSMENFVNDFEKKGLFDVETDDMGLWDIETNFKNTAEAAKKFDMSVESVETMLRGLEAYGYNFDEIMFSGENINRYESSLEGIKSTYESMAEGDEKERLGELIENWDSDLAKYDEELSELTEDKVVHIEFEYDLAQLDAEISRLELERANGKRTVENNSDIITTKQVRREELENYLVENRGLEIPVEYKVADSAISQLQEQLRNTEDESTKLELQAEIENLTDLQNDMLNAFDSSDLSWDEFLKTDEYDKFSDKIEGVKKEVEELTGEEVTVDLTSNDLVTPKLDEIEQRELISKECALIAEDEATNIIDLWNQLAPEPKFAELTAEDQATYVVEMWNSMTPEQKSAYLSGEMTITDNLTGKVIEANNALNILPTSVSPSIDVDSNAKSITNAAKLHLDSIDGKTVHTYIYTHKKNDSELAGIVHVNGTAHAKGTAYTRGSIPGDAFTNPRYRTKKGEVALMGEEDQEIVVHGNDWWTVGDDGAGFDYVPPNSLVFNARQTKELLRNGFTRSRGKAHLEGTAYRLGSSNTSGSKKTSSGKSSSKSSSKSSKSTSKALNAISNWFDWIKVHLDRLARNSENAEKAIERATGLGDTLSAINKTIEAVTKEQDAAAKGAEKYLDTAKKVAKNTGLSSSIQKKIQDGTIDITKYTEKTQKKISAYQEYYEKYLDCLDQVADLEDQAIELALSRLDKITEYHEAVSSVHESLIDANEANLDYREEMGYSAISDTQKELLQSSIDEAKAIKENAYANYNKYQEEFNSLLKSGVLQKDSIEYYDRLSEINDLKAAYYEASTAVLEHADALREIEYTKLQQAIDGFSRASEKLSNQVELLESRDEKVAESIYTEQIGKNNSQIQKQYELRQAKLAEQANYAVNSVRYQELADEISDIDGEIINLLTDNEELKNSIVELRFDPLIESVEKLQDVRSELEDFMDLINEEALFDSDTGALTGEGVANIYLIEQAMNSAKQEIAEYTEGLAKLEANFANGNISQEEFNEMNAEYREGIRDAIKDVKSYADTLSDLYITQMEKENELLQEIIDKRKEALKRKEDYYNYDRNISKKSRDINMLKAQIAALDGVKYCPFYLIAGNPLESYKLQHKYEIKLSVNV